MLLEDELILPGETELSVTGLAFESGGFDRCSRPEDICFLNARDIRDIGFLESFETEAEEIISLPRTLVFIGVIYYFFRYAKVYGVTGGILLLRVD